MRELLWKIRDTRSHWKQNFHEWRERRKAWKRFWNSYRQYQKVTLNKEFQPDITHLYPCLGDDVGELDIEPVYYYQDAWAFEKIVKRSPSRHVDVGSHHKFVALLSKVVPVTMVDLRSLSLQMDSLDFRKGSILDLPFESETLPSVSSLCVVEHIGLGRYGDPLDPYGSEKAIQELMRVVMPDGDLYLSVPIEDQNRLYFNACRVFKEEYLFELFKPFQLCGTAYIYGKELCTEPKKEQQGVGCYHLKRPK